MEKYKKGGDGEIFRKGENIVKKFDQKRFFDSERQIKFFSHPFIIKTILIDEKELSIEYPFYPGDIEKPCRDIKEVIKMLFQISDALAYLDSKDFYYTDISPKNILKSKEGDYVLIDFGRLTKKYDIISAPPQFNTKAKKDGFWGAKNALFIPSLYLIYTAMFYFNGDYENLQKTHPLLKKIYEWATEKRPTILGMRNYIFNCFSEPKKYLINNAIHFAVKYDKDNGTEILKEIDKKDFQTYKKTFEYR